MTNYELAIIVSPGLTNPEIEKRVDKVRQDLSKIGKIQSEDIWGMRDLAYRIKSCDQGFYGIFYLEAEPGALDELDQEMRIDPAILRHLILTHDADYVPVVRLDEESAPVEAQKLRVQAAAKVETKIEEENKEDEKVADREEAEEEVSEKRAERAYEKGKEKELEKEEIKAEKKEEVKEIEKDEDSMKKKTSTKKKSSLDDLDAALDELLKD